ncbi:MAG: FHA domain-containing protein [Planctomycetota bacterium]|jgi:pSer/pThr/pTyr-binding forkhead associated (FHA) protein
MAYKLTVVFGGRTIERRDVDTHHEKFVIGRSRECDLVIDNLGISRAHSEIILENGVPILRDLKSNNGTFVNGRRVTRHHLNDGDEVAIGKFTITFQRDEGHLEDDDEELEEKVEGGEFTVAIDSRVMEQRQRERSSKLKAYLLLDEKGRKRAFVLDRAIFMVGKASVCNLQVGGWFVAKKHCIVFRDDASFRVIDTSQKNRTYLNETAIDDERLKDGDVIRVGGHKIKFMVGVPAV